MDSICFLFVYVHFSFDLLYEMYVHLHCYFVLSPFPCKDPLNINSVKILHRYLLPLVPAFVIYLLGVSFQHE